MEPKISLCASATRIQWWMRFYDSLKGNKIPWEVVFAGHVKPDFTLPDNFKYIYCTVKPAQAYQISFWNSTGTHIMWTADDASYNEPSVNCDNCLDIAYEHWVGMDNRYNNDKKSVIACNICEDGGFPQLKFHRLFGGWTETPVMAPFALIERDYFLNKLGGYDREFISGQSENDTIMRVYEDGGRVEICMDAKHYVHHSQVHGKQHNKVNEFRKFYNEDRKVLENAWIKGGYGFYEKLNSYKNNNPESRKEVVANISKTRLIPFKPFIKTEDVCFKTQGQTGQWR